MILLHWLAFTKRYGTWIGCLVILALGLGFTSEPSALGQTIPSTGKIIIRKVVQSQPNDTTAFTFHANSELGGSSFSLTHNGSHEFLDVPSGDGYRVDETVPTGWVLSSATCDNGDDPTDEIVVAGGETIICTFTNTKLATLVIRKVTDPDPDPTQSVFSFTTEGGLSPASFTLKNGETRSFSNLQPKTGYKVTEGALSGWQLSDVSCTNGRTVTNIQLDPGETVTCTFTNDSTAPGLSLHLSDGDLVARPGALLTYTVSYANNSAFDAIAVSLRASVPDYTTYVGGGNWNCTPNGLAGSVCTHSLGTVAKGASGQVRFIVRVNSTVSAGVAEINSRAAIGTLILTEIDVDTEKTTLDAAPDLQLSKSADSDTTSPGGMIHYLLTYKNQGNQSATGVTLTETLPDHTTFDAANSSSGWQCTGTTCRLTVGNLASGSVGTTHFVVTVANPLPAGLTAITNEATIADDSANGSDPTPANNRAAVQTPVNRTFRLVATKSDALAIDADGDNVPSPGDTVEYVVTIRNHSDVGISGLVFRDTPDPNTTLLPGVQNSQGIVTAGNSAADTELVISVGELAGNGGSVIIRFRVRIIDTLPLNVTVIENQGTVSSNDFAEVKTDDPATPESEDPTRTPLRAFAQLKATLVDYLFVDADGNEVVSVGDNLIYRLTLQNIGNGAAGGLQIATTPNPGLALLPGTVATSLGTIGQGNSPSDVALRVEVDQLAAGASVLISYQMRIVSGAQDTVQNQVSIAVQTGVVNGTGQLVSDDPDVSGEANATVTTLGVTVAKLQVRYLPLVARGR